MIKIFNGVGKGYSALHLASSFRHEAAVRLLLSRGANVNLIDNNVSSYIYE